MEVNKVTFFVMGFKGLSTLKRVIHDHGAGVIDQLIVAPDKNVQNDHCEEILETCRKNSIPVSDRMDNFHVRTKYSIAIAWRWLIQIESPGELIVFHDSILPKYRGFSPLVTALIDGEREVGVTALFARADYDKGDIICQKSIPVVYPVKINEVINRLSEKYSELGSEIVKLIKDSSNIGAVPQDESLATYSLWRDEEDYRINWHMDSKNIRRFIDSVGYPYKGASTLINGEKIRILEAESMADVVIKNRTCGKVIFLENKLPVVVCGSGLLKMMQAVSDETGNSILPLKRFRTKFE